MRILGLQRFITTGQVTRLRFTGHRSSGSIACVGGRVALGRRREAAWSEPVVCGHPLRDGYYAADQRSAQFNCSYLETDITELWLVELFVKL